MNSQAVYNSNLERIQKIMRFEKTDRPAVVPVANAFCAKAAGVKLAEYCRPGHDTAATNLKCWQILKPMVDGVQCVVFSPYALTRTWLSKVRVAGVDLPEDELWQVVEAEVMPVEDYKTIIEGGFYKWLDKFMEEKLDNLFDKAVPALAQEEEGRRKFKDAGIVPLINASISIPYESICGARGMVQFMMDLYKRKDLVKEALDVAYVEMLEANRALLRRIKPMGVWVGGWRTASELLSPKIWREFVWPYYKGMVEMVIEEGVIPLMHLDSDWTRDLDFFKELPKYKCIMSPDGSTDIRQARKVLDNHVCLLGDVPAELLAFGTVEDVTNYTTGLIKDLGTGYMVASGCDVPFNAKPENVEAMIAAAHNV